MLVGVSAEMLGVMDRALGLAVEVLEEFGHSNRETDYDIYAGRQAQVPMCYLLRARKV